MEIADRGVHTATLSGMYTHHLDFEPNVLHSIRLQQ
jgi:hypothetical protein